MARLAVLLTEEKGVLCQSRRSRDARQSAAVILVVEQTLPRGLVTVGGSVDLPLGPIEGMKGLLWPLLRLRCFPSPPPPL